MCASGRWWEGYSGFGWDVTETQRVFGDQMHALRAIADLAGPAERALCGGRGCWWAGSMSGAAQDWAQQETMTASHAIHGIRQGAGGATATFV